MRARVAVATALLALVAAPSAYAGQKPNGHELWRTYPLKPKVSATPATPTATATATATRTPAPPPAKRGGGGGWAPIALAGLAAAAAAAGAAALARRRRRTGAAREAGPATAPAPAAAHPAAAQPPAGGSRTRRFAPRKRRFQPSARPPAEPAAPAARRFAPSRTTERLRAAVDMQLGREWPWPEGSEGLWRCEIGPDRAALSSRFRAVLHSPDAEPPRVLAVSSAGPAGGDWQSAAPLEQAVNALAAQLVADGWEPVEGTGDPYTRRFCWRHDRAPDVRLQETAWFA